MLPLALFGNLKFFVVCILLFFVAAAADCDDYSFDILRTLLLLNFLMLCMKVVRVNKDASVSEIAAAAAAAMSSSSSQSPSSHMLLFPEVPGLLRPSSYAIDQPLSPPLTASGIIAAHPPPLSLFWQSFPVDSTVRMFLFFVVVVVVVRMRMIEMQ